MKLLQKFDTTFFEPRFFLLRTVASIGCCFY